MTLANGEYTYEKTIRPEAAISDLDMQIMKDIFYDADLKDGNTEAIVMGEVYVGTQSTEDISDDRNVSWKSFVDEYIVTGENSTEVDGNENGNWLKVVDVDGDGVADYVMKTIYTFAGVEDIDRDDNIELTAVDANLNDGDEVNKIDEDVDIVSEDELSEGDIVYYALIDGNAQTYLAEMVTAEIDSVNRRTDTATTTDGDEYVESDVHNHVVWDEFDDGVVNLAGNTSYDLYLDKYGYLGVFTETATSGDFALLTDGWFMSQRAGDEYAAMVWDREAQELVDTDITSGGDLFISDSDNNHWGQLEYFVGINDDGLPVGDDMKTIVASLSADGDLTPVDDVFNKRDVRIVAIDDNEILGRSYTNGTSYTTSSRADKAYDLNSGDVEIRALASTVYYYVYEDSNGNTVVNEYVGYNNLPSLDAASKDMIEDVYAVGTRTDREGSNSESGETEYFTASVVVVEFSGRYLADAEQVFIVDTPVVGTNVHIDEVEVIRADGTFETVTIDLENSDYETIGNRAEADYGVANYRTLMPGLYYMWETEDEGIYTVTAMSHEDIADNNYAVGVVTTGAQYEDDWAEIQEYIYNNSYSIEDAAIQSWPEFRVADDSLFYTLSYDWDDDFNGTLTSSNARTVLSEEGERIETLDGRVYADNTVLIAYNGDDEIVYAVSLANFDGMNRAETQMVVNFAQFVWDNVKPAAEVTYGTNAPSVTLAGVVAASDWTDNGNGSFSVSIPYTVWTALDADAQYVVSPATGNEIAISGLTTFTSKDVLVDVDTGAASAVADGTQTITVMSQGDNGDATETYTFVVTYMKDSSSTELFYEGTQVAGRYYDCNTAGTTIWMLTESGDYFTYGSSDYDWTFYNMDGKKIPDADLDNTTTLGLSYATVTVTADNGDSAEYTITFNNYSLKAADVVSTAQDMYDNGEDLDVIMTDIHAAGVTVPADIAKVMKAIDAPAEDVWAAWDEAWDATSSDYPEAVATAMKGADYKAEDIAAGYVALWASQTAPKGLTDIEVELVDDKLVFEIDKDGTPAISGTDLFDVAEAAGISKDSLVLSWSDDRGGVANDKTFAEFAAQWTAMLTNIKAGYNYTVEATNGDMSITVELKGV